MKGQALRHVFETDHSKATIALKEGIELSSSIHLALTNFADQGDLKSLENAECFLESLEAAVARLRLLTARKEAYEPGYMDSMRDGRQIFEEYGYELGSRDTLRRDVAL